MSQSLIVMELKGVESSLYAMATKSRELMAAAELGLRKGMEQFKAEVIRDQMTGRRYADFGLNVGHGTLRRSWKTKTYEYGDEYIVKLANDSKYAAIHQYGGTITPKSAGALTVPVHSSAKGHYAREFPDLKFIPRQGKPPLLVRITDKGTKNSKARFDIMYVLMKSVRIPKRLHVIEEFQASGNEIIMRNIRGAVNLAAQKATATTSGFHAR